MHYPIGTQWSMTTNPHREIEQSVGLDKRIAYEASFVAATTPMPSRPSRLTEEQVHQVINGCSDSRATRQVQTWAQNNDYEALRNVMTSAWWKKDRSDIVRPELTYAVAHMMVDGSGNATFAREWMETFGHKTELAREHLKDLWSDTANDRFLDQTRLGLAIVADVFKILTYDDERIASILPIMGYRDDDNGMDAKKAEGLAHILRVTAPDTTPQIDTVNANGQIVKKPLPEVLYTYTTLRVRHMLGAIELAYGNAEDRDDILGMMRSSINVMVNMHRLPLESRIDDSPLWDSMMRWGDQNLGPRIWHATVLPKLPFVQGILEKCPDDMIFKRLEQVATLGADLQEPMKLKVNGQEKTMRILDAAVNYARPNVVGWLLSRGCDPRLESRDSMTGEVVSAQTLAAARLTTTDISNPNYPAVRRVSELISSDLARRSALEVIAELNTSATPAPRH